MPMFYILDEHGVITSTDDVIEWGESHEKGCKFIAADNITDDIRVSTVFLGIDHAFDPDGPTVLFETMVFGGPSNESRYRCSTKEEALEQHKRISDSLRDWEEIEKKS